MPKTAADFLNDLNERGLVPAAVVASLKGQVAKSATAVSPATVAKLLVDEGHLTAAQAQQLLGTAPAIAKQSAAPAADLAPLDDLQPLDDLTPLDQVIPLDDLTPLDDLSDLGAGPAIAADPLAAAKPQVASSQPAKWAQPVSAKPIPAQAAPAQPVAAVPQPVERKSSLGVVLIVLLVVVLVGGGAAGVFLLLPRGGGEAALAAADQDYQAKQYDAAVAKYDAFLAAYPASEQASLASVRRAAAKVLAARAGSLQNWQPVIAAAKEVLPPVAGAAELSQVHAELAPLLMDMAAELASEAAEVAATADKLAVARDALALASDGRFVPGPVRQWQRLELAEENVARAAYALDRARALDDGVAAVKKAAETGDVDVAFADRAKLLAAYPDMTGESSLRDLGTTWATAAAGKVQTAEYSTPAETTEKNTGIVGSVVFTTSLATIAASEAGPPTIFAAGSSVWGLDTATGRVLWRRVAGGVHLPVRVGADADSDVLLVDSAASELVRAAARSGAIKWRHQLGSPIAGSPVVVGSQVFVTIRSGQIVAADAASGTGKLSAQLPQAARVGAIADTSGQNLVQLADHSLLYVFSAADLKCARAVFVGHEPAAVVVAPILLSKHLVIAENRGSATSTLHVLALDAGGLPQAVVQQIELAGHVLAPPVVLTDRLIVATDQGRVLAYESAADPTAGLKEIAQSEAGSAAGITRFPVLIQGNLLIAGQGLRQFGPPAGGSLKPAWSALGDDILLGPPQVAGDTIVTIRRPAGSAGIVAAGLNPADGKPRWETRVGEPLQSIAVLSDSTSIAVATAAGTSATLAAAGLSGQKIAPLGAAPAATSQVARPRDQSSQAIRWREGVIVAGPSGAISYVDPKSGAPKADPLQLRLRPGQRLENCSLAAAGEQGNQLVISDDQQSLYLVDLAGDGGPKLTELAAAQLESPPISGLAVGDQVVGLVDRRGQLITFSLPNLKSAASIDLKAAAVVAGPTRIGDVVVLATDRGELLGFDRSLAQSWKVPMPHGPPAGEFVADGTSIVMACRGGWVCRLNSSSGEEIAAVDLGQSLAGTPVVISGNAIVPTADGAILKVSLPAEKGAAP